MNKITHTEIYIYISIDMHVSDAIERAETNRIPLDFPA